MNELDYLVNALRQYGDRDSIHLTSAAQLLGAVSRQLDQVPAWTHPLGFVHLELTPIAQVHENERVRMHIWPSHDISPDPLGKVHDHIWRLTSTVLLGALSDHSFRAQAALDGPFDGVRVHYGSEDKFSIEGRYELEEIECRALERGAIYRLEPGVIHETEIRIRPTATLVLADESKRDPNHGPLILTRRGSGSHGTARRQPLSAPEVSRHLSELMKWAEAGL